MALGSGVSGRVGRRVGVSGRLAGLVADSGVAFDRSNVREVVMAVAGTEAPLARGCEIQAVVDLLVGMGPIEPLLRDPEVTDVFVNGPEEVWVDRGGALSRAAVSFPDSQAIVAAVERVVTPLGLRIDHSSPIVDARLHDGSRLHAVIPPASPEGPIVAIRRFTQAVPTLDRLVELGVATDAQVSAIREMVDERVTLLVSGGTGAGKTTLLNLIGSLFAPEERVVVIEDATELDILGHVVRLESQPANGEGRGAITMSELVKSSLRLRPDRIVIGEVRGPEALDLVKALNTGHEGSMSTIHANGPREALWRLEMLASSGGAVSAELIRRQIEHSIRHVVHIERRGGRRLITHVGEVPE